MLNFILRLLGMKIERVYCADCRHSERPITVYDDWKCLINYKIKHGACRIERIYSNCHIKNFWNDCKDFEKKLL